MIELVAQDRPETSFDRSQELRVIERDNSGYPDVGNTQATSKTKTPVQARQGVISGRVITVMLISIVLLVAGLVAAYIFTS